MENNIKNHIGHAIAIYTYSSGKHLTSRLNLLGFQVSCFCAVLDEGIEDRNKKKEHERWQRYEQRLASKLYILRNAYFPALETNLYIPDLRARFEIKMDELERDVMRVINKENMTASSLMQQAMTTLGDHRRVLTGEPEEDT